MKKTFKWGICNSGSTTVEMCLVMPIVFIVIVLCIALLVNSSVDMKAQQMAYSTIYTYDVDMDNKDINIENRWKLYTEKGFVKAEPKDIRGILGYSNQIVLYCTEYNKCTERLRRWQAYGDIFQE
ncbi:MAG: pilus assembly protein [Lachnospiraceae bacterium]|nr:pilus assembly protein [Lachnospiraceae bacterium]